ncbi:MAG: PP2C family protein-serine/threonine phosphatase [Ktedonobacteraceae bacterium]
MSMRSNDQEIGRGFGRFAFSILGGLLLAFQLVLPSHAFALSVRIASSANPPTSKSLALSEVSVVRLVYSYNAKPATKGTTSGNPVLCTSVGVLAKSMPASTSSSLNSWVLTDGSLRNTAPAPCAPAGSSSRGKTSTTYTLSSINVYANDAYTGNAPANALLGTYTVAANNVPLCFATPCMNGAFFFSFHTDQLQPTLDVATLNTLQQFGIALTSQASATARPPVPLTNTAAAMAFLNPTQVMLDVTSSQNEAGMPFINNAGQMVAMHLQNTITLTSADYNAFVAHQPALNNALPNPLQVAWENGIDAYYQHNYQDAIKEFQIVEGLNPNLVAAKTFEESATALSTTQSNPVKGTSLPSTETTTFFGIPLSTLLIGGIAAATVLLVFLLIIVFLLIRRRRELARFKAEQAQAQWNAEKEVQQIQHSRTTANLQSVATELPCPGCQKLIRATETTCPYCGTLVAASVSGLHLHALPPSPAPQIQANHIQTFGSSTPSISELPTIEFSPVNSSGDTEKTLPYAIEQLKSHNLSLAVGYLTDPGIKRKHKPNEDSLFAMQGAGTNKSHSQEYGLFVVADGMGGHANGQNASRMAIQTIIDYMLPQMSEKKQLSDEAFAKLLRDGVQHANQAVHQRNLEERADMGTTMTAALVFGSTAYVANVGDSRTYLYREPDGLAKVTHDHSVVASLVEAGIIQPDDIYTHPKRNQIYRSLGEKPVVDVDSFVVPLKAGDKLLLCSDGLWDMVRDPEIQRLMSDPTPDPSKLGQKLIQAALDGGGEDNVSVIVVSFSESEVSPSGQASMKGIQLLYKPETVTVPDLPQS